MVFEHAIFLPAPPPRAPTLSKVPLVKWNRRFSYLSSTHALLPRGLNHVYDETGGEKLSGVLLHTKFLHIVLQGATEENSSVSILKILTSTKSITTV